MLFDGEGKYWSVSVFKHDPNLSSLWGIKANSLNDKIKIKSHIITADDRNPTLLIGLCKEWSPDMKNITSRACSDMSYTEAFISFQTNWFELAFLYIFIMNMCTKWI